MTVSKQGGAVGFVLRGRGLSVLLLGWSLAASWEVGTSQAAKDPRCELIYSADPKNVPDAIARLKAGNFALVYVDMVGRAHAVEAIPVLRTLFNEHTEPIGRMKLASVLVKLGDREATYWDFLVREVTPVVESDAPFFVTVTAEGKLEAGPSPEFTAWAAKQNRVGEGLGAQAVYEQPGKVMLLGDTGDRRAIPLLQRGLRSPNYFVARAAAQALATMHDDSSLPLVIAVCERAPAELAEALAETLIPFPEARAQATVNRYVPSRRLRGCERS